MIQKILKPQETYKERDGFNMKSISRFACLIVCTAFVLTLTPSIVAVSPKSSTILTETEISDNFSMRDAQINQLDSIGSFEHFQSMTVDPTDEGAIQGMITSLLIGKVQVENSYMDVPLEQMLTSQILSSNTQEESNTENSGLVEEQIVVLPEDFEQIINGYEDTTPDSDISDGYLTNDNLTFFVQKAQLFGNMRKNAGIVVTDENLEYAFSPISYSGNHATVDVTEYYSFQLNTIDVRSQVNTEYHIVLERNNAGVWDIKEITSNDWFDQSANYEPFDVDQLLSKMDSMDSGIDTTNTTIHTEVQETISLMPAATTVNSLDYTIKAARVANYADTFWDSYNTSLYGNYNTTGGDCMNFASQCLAAGLGFSSDSTSITNGTAPCDNVGNYKWKPKTSPFISCSSFRTYLSSNSDSGETGLLGTVETLTSKTHTYKAGDILHVDNGSGTPYAHAAVVTHTGDKSTALVSAHNNDRHNVTISWMWNTSSDIKLCSITGYYTYSNCSGHTFTNPSGTNNGTDSTCNNCGYSRLRIDATTFAPLSKGATKTISANTSIKCYRIAVGITSPSGNITWLPYAMNSSSFSSSYTFSESGIYEIIVAARDMNDSITGNTGTSFTYQVRVT